MLLIADQTNDEHPQRMSIGSSMLDSVVEEDNDDDIDLSASSGRVNSAVYFHILPTLQDVDRLPIESLGRYSLEIPLHRLFTV